MTKEPQSGSGPTVDERSAEPEATGDGGGPSTTGGGVRAAGRPHWIPLVGAIVVGAVVLFGASYFVATRFFRRPAPSAPSATRSPAPGSENQIPANFVTFRDEEAGVSISYPKAWTRFKTKSGVEQVKLTAGVRNSGDLLQLRVIPLPAAIPSSEIFSLKKSFDQYLGADNLNIIKQQQITLNGLVGWHYLYTFADKDNGRSGIQSQYLLASGAKIDVLIFQALPKEDFKGLADLFDQIAGTFRSTPRAEPQPAPAPSPGN